MHLHDVLSLLYKFFPLKAIGINEPELDADCTSPTFMEL